MSTNSSLEALQNAAQARVLDTILKLSRCGLQSIDLPLPQLVVCGDQSAGKSSLFEALTGITFPRSDLVYTSMYQNSSPRIFQESGRGDGNR